MGRGIKSEHCAQDENFNSIASVEPHLKKGTDLTSFPIVRVVGWLISGAGKGGCIC